MIGGRPQPKASSDRPTAEPRASLPALSLSRASKYFGGLFRLPSTRAFVALWLLVLCVPPLRSLLRMQTMGSSLTYDIPWTWNQQSVFSMRRLSRLHPNDVRVQSQMPLNEEPLEGADEDEIIVGPAIPAPAKAMAPDVRQNIAEFDKLINRSPDETWLLAKRMNYTLQVFRHDRLSGEYDERYRNNRALRRKSPPEKSPSAANFSRDDWQRAMKLAQTGAVAEPDNTYWDWVQAWLLYANHQDAACFAAMKRAGQRAKFDSHWYDELRAKIGAHELARPLLFEEKSRLVQQSQPSLQSFESLGHSLLWQSRKREKSGDARGGLLLRCDLARACALMMRGRNAFFMGERAGELQRVAWRLAPTRMQESDLSGGWSGQGDVGEASLQMAKAFAAYARRLGRADLANETLRLGKDRAEFRRLKWQHRNGSNLHSALSAFALMTGLFWMGFTNLWQIAALPAIWIVLSLVLLRSHRDASVPAARKVLWLVIATALAFAALAIWLAILTTPIFGSWPSDPAARDRANIGLLCAGVFVVTPALFGALWSWVWAVQLVWRERKTLLAPEPPKYEGESAKLLVPNPWPLMVRIATWSIIVMALLGWLGALVAWRTGATVWHLPLAPIFEPQRKDI